MCLSSIIVLGCINTMKIELVPRRKVGCLQCFVDWRYFCANLMQKQSQLLETKGKVSMWNSVTYLFQTEVSAISTRVASAARLSVTRRTIHTTFVFQFFQGWKTLSTVFWFYSKDILRFLHGFCSPCYPNVRIKGLIMGGGGCKCSFLENLLIICETK